MGYKKVGNEGSLKGAWPLLLRVWLKYVNYNSVVPIVCLATGILVPF